MLKAGFSGPGGRLVWLLASVGLALIGCWTAQEQTTASNIGGLEIHARDCYGKALPFCRLILEHVLDSVPKGLSDSIFARTVLTAEHAAETATDSTGRHLFPNLTPGFYNVHLGAPLPRVDASGDCARGSVWLVRVARDSVAVVTVAQIDRSRPPTTERLRWRPVYHTRP